MMLCVYCVSNLTLHFKGVCESDRYSGVNIAPAICL